MKMFVASILLGLVAVEAFPMGSEAVVKREVPQEHSHQQFITTVAASLRANNPNNIGDPVFGLLGNAAAAGGLGKLKDPDCLQQETADQAFTNAKAAKDVNGMTAALVYRALERNTGKVGLASNACKSAKAVNPEIASVSQHQDPASAGAAATNKAITLNLAKQIASVGGNPQDALKAGTFKPGSTSDNTGKGNTCDDANDKTGCIFTQNLLVPDASAAEINAAVGGKAGAGAAAAAAPAAGAAAQGANNGAAKAQGGGSGAAGNAASATTGGAATGAADFGAAKCSDPAIAFGVGFDGRKEASFEPDDKATFQHGSALNAGIVAQFICDRLNDECKASAATVSKCRAAQAQVNGRKDAAAADLFNKALGVQATKVGVDEKAA